jgi:hypothetical protein
VAVDDEAALAEIVQRRPDVAALRVDERRDRVVEERIGVEDIPADRVGLGRVLEERVLEDERDLGADLVLVASRAERALAQRARATR